MADTSDAEHGPLTWLERLLAMAVISSAVDRALIGTGPLHYRERAVVYAEIAARCGWRSYLDYALGQLAVARHV